MKKDYKVRELTPREMRCGIAACPGIYEVEKVKRLSGQGSNFTNGGDVYYIIGEEVNPKEFGLEDKVGEGEVLIKIPKGIIDEMER